MEENIKKIKAKENGIKEIIEENDCFKIISSNREIELSIV